MALELDGIWGRRTAEPVVAVRCIECRRPRDGDGPWYLWFADIGELAIYCPECAEREFGGD